MCTLVLVKCLGGLSLPMNSVVTLSDRPHITIDVKQQNSNNQAQCRCTYNSENNVVSTTTVQPRYSATLWPTDDLPRESEAHSYTKRYTKIMLYIQ